MAKQDKIKVLVVAPLPPPDFGGIANWSRILRKTFAESPHWRLHFVDSAARYRAVTTHALIARLIGGSFHACQTIVAVYRSIKRLRPQIMHICTSGGLSSARNIVSLRIARHFGIPRLIHYRMGAIPKAFAKKGMEWRWTLRAMKLADVVITLDRRSEACVRESLPGKRVVTLPNMVEVDALDAICAAMKPRSPETQEFHVTFVGQIIPAKGVAELVEACAKLAGCGLRLNLVGPIADKFRKQLVELAAGDTPRDWLRFYGSKSHDEAVCIMFNADLIALPSYSEGFPNVVLEAMALSKAVLATSVGAIPEMLDIGGEEECGIIVPPREIEPLAAAIERLMNDPQLRSDLGKRARRRAERLYAAPVASRRLADLWDSLLHQDAALPKVLPIACGPDDSREAS